MSGSPKFNRSGRDTVNLSSPVKPEAKTKQHAQELRAILQDRLMELEREKTEWIPREARLHNECEKLVSQLRDLEVQNCAEQSSTESQHITSLSQAKQRHQRSVRALEGRIEETLVPIEDEPEDDAEVIALREELAAQESASEALSEVDILDPDAEDRLRQLEDRLDEVEQLHEDALVRREEDSRRATQMLTQLLEKEAQEDEIRQEELVERMERLNAIDQEHGEKVADLEREWKAQKDRIAAGLKSATAQIQKLQQTVAARQMEYEKKSAALQTTGDKLRAQLEEFTIRQQQQIRESGACAKRFADEKRRFVAMQRELEMLNAEKFRETIEYNTLSRGVSTKDGHILTQMSASPERKRENVTTRFTKSNPL
jgi:chromosome segregation ATPase